MYCFYETFIYKSQTIRIKRIDVIVIKTTVTLVKGKKQYKRIRARTVNVIYHKQSDGALSFAGARSINELLHRSTFIGSYYDNQH